MLPAWLDPYLLHAADTWYRLRPRPRLPRDALLQTRIISHRGERDDRQVLENTFAAFDPLPGRVHGLECDIRFSRDGTPMVFHDADLLRLYACHERLCDLSFHEIRKRFPQIPTLAELTRRYGRRLHLILEFKAEVRQAPARQLASVTAALSGLQGSRDFHLMSLDIPTLEWLGQAYPHCRVTIARHNVAQMSAYGLSSGCAGITGHYALLDKRHNRPHLAAGQWIGLGFPQTRHQLRYALHQGARWIFSNQALALEALREDEIKLSRA